MQGTKEVIGGHVDAELAGEIRRLAEEGNRSVSREVAAALRAHVARETSASGAAHPLGSRGAGATEDES
jgi:hypothetical protein